MVNLFDKWMASRYAIVFIIFSGFVVRLVGAALSPFPGIADSNHYYNLARNLAAGRGFVIDYIWQYHNPPVSVTHPIDYWMPLPALLPALGLRLAPDSLFAALIPSVIIGTLILVLTYSTARLLDQRHSVHVVALLCVVFIPQHVMNAVRTDTTLYYVLFVGLACIFFYFSMQKQGNWLILAGICSGLAYLSRQDGIILAPAFILAITIYRLLGQKINIGRLWLFPLGWLLIVMPWLWRNQMVLGVWTPSSASRTLFMTSFIDQFTYGRELTLQRYLDWGWSNIISNIVTQLLANIKTMYTLLGIYVPVGAVIGIFTMILRWKQNPERVLFFVFPFSILLGLFSFYTFVTPFHTMGGSFYKSYQFIIPFMCFACAWTVVEFIPKRIAFVTGLIIAGFMFLNSVDTLRLDFIASTNFRDSIQALSIELDAYGDTNGDGEIIIMTQDPYILNYFGYRALMIPSDPRDMILEAVYRYEVDYILLPAARPALDGLLNNTESDPRFRWLPATGNYQLLRIVPPDS